MKTATLEGSLASIRRLNRIGALTIAGLALAVGGWAAFTEISGAVIAPGRVVVEGNTRKIQHPDGGIVSQIQVHDGDQVEAGQLLVRLDDVLLRTSLDIVSKRMSELVARRARLTAERDGQEDLRVAMQFAGWRLNAATAEALSGERRLFDLRRRAREGKRGQLAQRKLQSLETIRGLDVQLQAAAEDLSLIQRELDGDRMLFKKGLMQISRLTALERQRTRASATHGNLLASIARARARLAEDELQLLQIDQDLASTVANELREVDAKLGELKQRRLAAEAKVSRVEIRSPVRGIVHASQVHTIGGVVNAGEVIMQIVPSGDALVIEARVSPRDIDQVRVGQDGRLRFTSLNQRTTPEIAGTVSRVAADATEEPRLQQVYFTVQVRIPEVERRRLDDTVLVPGMPVEVFLRTEDRTVLSYLVKPLSDQLQRTFR